MIDLSAKFKDPNVIVIYATDLITHCGLCGSPFNFKFKGGEYLSRAVDGFNTFVWGELRCCGKTFVVQKIREVDSHHIHNGRHLERCPPVGCV